MTLRAVHHTSASQRQQGREAVEGLRRVRGVSWRWRDDVPAEMGLTAGAIQAGVIAQEVQAAFPDLVVKHKSGYLMVDYPGLAMRIAAATEGVRERIARLTSAAKAAKASDELLKETTEPISQALERLGRGDARISKEDYQALVGALVEAVKQLDTRVSDLEGREEGN